MKLALAWEGNERKKLNESRIIKFIFLCNLYSYIKFPYASNPSLKSLKQVLKFIMNGSILRNEFLKNRAKINRLTYIKPRNLCLSLVRKAKKECCSNLDRQNVVESKYCLKYLKHLFSNESSSFSKLVKNDMFPNYDNDILPVLHIYSPTLYLVWMYPNMKIRQQLWTNLKIQFSN